MKKFWVIIWCILLLLTGVEVLATQTMDDLSESLVRLHVIAEDDSAQEQTLKLKVRDRILSEFGDCLSGSSDIAAVKAYVRTHLDDFKRVAEDELRANGSDRTVRVSFEKTAFDTREYGDVRLPAGYYDALRIVIGQGEGQNWWCVLFPPLCFVEDAKGTLPTQSEAVLKENLSDESFELITADGDLNVKVRFKLVELWETAKIKTAQAWGGK